MDSSLSLDADLLRAFSVQGKVAVVTGASSGLGRAIALLLSRFGCSLLMADVDADGLATSLGEVRKKGGQGIVQQVDVSDPEAVEALARTAVAEFSRIDIWVNVAGVVDISPVTETRPEVATRILAVNALGVQYGCAAAGRAMMLSGGGAIVNISSGGGEFPVPGMATYCMSKAGVNQLTRVCAKEFGPHRIRVNAVAPGWIETPMSSEVFRGPDGQIDPVAREAYIAQQIAATPLGILGTPEDVAYAVLYLVSGVSRYVTGQILTVSGGFAL